MSDQVQTISERIEEFVAAKNAEGEYATVRLTAKALNLKQTEVKDNLPVGAKLLASKNGTLSESQIQLSTGEEEAEIDAATIPTSTESVQQMLPKRERRKKMETEVAEVQLDENGNPIPAEEKVICVICGNPVRKNTIVRRGICPLCFRQLAKNVGLNATKLEALTDEEFDAAVGEELSRRRTLEEYKASRVLTNEQFKAMEGSIIPVKEVFAAAKAAGYGPGRVAQAMGGDRFRHEPLGGFGSVWTPYFVGARNSWYFDVKILDHLNDLQKPVKEKKAKSTSGKGTGTSRKGSRGAMMTPVADGDDEVTALMEGEGSPDDGYVDEPYQEYDDPFADDEESTEEA